MRKKSSRLHNALYIAVTIRPTVDAALIPARRTVLAMQGKSCNFRRSSASLSLARAVVVFPIACTASKTSEHCGIVRATAISCTITVAVITKNIMWLRTGRRHNPRMGMARESSGTKLLRVTRVPMSACMITVKKQTITLGSLYSFFLSVFTLMSFFFSLSFLLASPCPKTIPI